MIIGKGLIARKFMNITLPAGKVIFASGVSNSNETKKKEFLREFNLLKETIKSLKREEQLIYFSTLSIYDLSQEQSPYIEHKKEVESFIIRNHQNYLIIRLPNIVGEGGNPNTLINFLVKRIKESVEIQVWKNARRSFMDVDDLVDMVRLAVEKEISGTLDLFIPIKYSAEETVDILCEVIGVTANKHPLDKGSDYIPEPSETLQKILEGFDVTHSYLKKVVKKYYVL